MQDLIEVIEQNHIQEEFREALAGLLDENTVNITRADALEVLRLASESPEALELLGILVSDDAVDVLLEDMVEDLLEAVQSEDE